MRGEQGQSSVRLASLEYLDALRSGEDEALLQKLVDDVRSIFGADACMLNLVLAETVHPRVSAGDLPEGMVGASEISHSEMVCPHVVETETAVSVEDLREGGRFDGRGLYEKHGFRSYAGAPLVTSSGVAIGTLCVMNRRPREFREDEMTLLTAFASAGGIRLELLGAIRREKTAREKEGRRNLEYRRVLDSSPDVIFTTDLDGTFQKISPAVEAVFGYEPEELVGRSYLDVVHPEDRRRSKKLTAAPGGVRFESRCRRKDGRVVWIEWNAMPLPEEGVIYCVARDTTGSRRRKEALRRSKARHRAIVETAFDAIITMGSNGRIKSFNQGAERVFGYEPGEVAGRPLTILMPNRFREMHDAGLGRYLKTGETRVIGQRRLELAGERKSGEEFPLELSISEVRDGEEPLFIGIIRDTSERHRAEKALRESEERFRSLVQNASDLIVIPEPEGTLRYVSPSVERVLGHRPEEMVGKMALDFVHPKDAGIVGAAIEGIWNNPGVSSPIEFRVRHADGSWRYMEAIGNNLMEEPSVRGLVLNARDVTERKALEEQLTYQAFHDPLTHLPNRILFTERLKHALGHAKRQKGAVAVLFLDLDNFKTVNDFIGHAMGDRILVEAAERISSCLRDGDTAARLGGDEFTVLLEDIADESAAARVARRISEEFKSPFMLGGEEIVITTSTGIAVSAAGEASPEDILRDADIAMYRAKNEGKAHHEIFDPRMDFHARERLKIEGDLRRAVERGEFKVHYQPEVVSKSGEIFGMEALVRWEHPEHGLVAPGRFIQIAEETGLILPIGRWVLEEACRQTRRWQAGRESPFLISVNLSARQFQHPDLVEDIAGVLENTGLSPCSLILEITESVVMDDADATIRTLGELKALGVQIAIDDFGTGYSSFSYLMRFPLDYLKIDRSFVDWLRGHSADTSLVSGIVSLSHTLGLKVVAEGVETAEQYRRLRETGCDLAQGYYFSKPLPEEAASELLAAKRRL